MKRQRVELSQVASRDNLALACWKAAQGKRHRPAVARYLDQADARLAELGARILNAEAPFGHSRRFVIHDPKRREITAACFEDRVLHHAMLNVTAARFERALVDSTYACRPGKGVHAAVVAVQRGVRRWPWVVQVDVAGYFGSIRHAVAMQQLRRLFKGEAFLELWVRILAAGSDNAGQGLPIGALTSQYLANHYLNTADRLLLGHPGVSAHVRYMDDIVWWCSDLNAAHRSLGLLKAHVEGALGLQLKARFHLGPSRDGLQFCGYRIKPGVVLAGPRKMRRARHQMRRLMCAESEGVAVQDLQRAHASLAAALLPAESLHFQQSLWWPEGAL